MVVTALSKAHQEMASFFSGVNNAKVYSQERINKGARSYSIYTGQGDSDADAKKVAVKKAVDILYGKGLPLQDGMRFYLNNDVGTQNRAFHFDSFGKTIAWITMGTTATKGGSGRGISSQNTPGFDSATKIAIHEIGHNLHAAHVGLNDFLRPMAENGRFTGRCPACALELSDYANDSPKEFVAEAFTAMIVGKPVSDAVRKEYDRLGGPPIPGAHPKVNTWVSARPRSGAMIGGHRR